MAVTVGSISTISVGASSANLSVGAASGGTAPYAYAFYRSTATGFSPGTANVIQSGASLSLADSGLTPGTVYYYRAIATDANAATGTDAQITLTTSAASPVPNQFGLQNLLGALDLQFNGDSIAVQFDPSYAGSLKLVAGQAVKFVAGASGIPLVQPCGSASDVCAGFVNYNTKDAVFAPGNILEMSMYGNVMYLYASLAINRGQFLTSLPSPIAGGCNGGVVPVTGSSTFPIIGFALDTVAIGNLVRVYIQAPVAPYAID